MTASSADPQEAALSASGCQSSLLISSRKVRGTSTTVITVTEPSDPASRWVRAATPSGLSTPAVAISTRTGRRLSGAGYSPRAKEVA